MRGSRLFRNFILCLLGGGLACCLATPAICAAGDGQDGPAKLHSHRKSTSTEDDAPAPALPPGGWSIDIEPQGNLFPSLLIASATLRNAPMDVADAPRETAPKSKATGKGSGAGRLHKAEAPPHPAAIVLGEGNGLISIHLRLPADAAVPAHLRVQLKENALMEGGLFEAELTERDREYVLAPSIDYKYDALNQVHQAEPLNVEFSLSLDGRNLGQKFATAQVHTVNECLYGYQSPEMPDSYQDLAWMFAAYVNEDHPAVRDLLKEAQATHVANGFDGYQSGKAGAVLLQVFAFWDVLEKKAFSYSDIGTPSSESDTLWNMHVRFLDESLADGQANCVDGSVLLASLLRKVGIKPFLVMQPGHMYLGFYLDADCKTSACVETTMLCSGGSSERAVHPNRTLASAAGPEAKNLPSWKTFNAALESATSEFRRNKKKFDHGDDPDYQVIDIDAARRVGILPIASVARQ